MHTESGQVSGDFSGKKLTSLRYCTHCEDEKLFDVRVWESSCGGFEDYKYTCPTCKHGFWIDGPDS